MKTLFGTDGIRGVAGSFPLDPKTIYAIGLALGDWIGVKPDGGRVLLGRDTRESGQWISDQLDKALTQKGLEVIHDVGVITTPGLAYLARVHCYDLGIMISASHNPYQDNGIKLFSRDGFKLTDEIELELERKIYSLVGTSAILGGAPLVGRAIKMELLVEDYVTFLGKQSQANFHSLRIGLDVCNGAAYSIAPQIFSQLGAEVTVVNNRPDGQNINRNCGSVHLGGLTEVVKENRLDFGIGFDGDADRALFVTGTGKLFAGDHVLYALALDWKGRGELTGKKVVGTIMTNFALENILAAEGINLVRTPVGDKYILEAMKMSGAILGGEPSGHVILGKLQTTGDGILTAVKLTELLLRRRISLDELACGYEPYPQVLDGVRVAQKLPIEESPQLNFLIRRAKAQLGGSGRMVVRYSGTEPLLRIMAEGHEMSQVDEVVKDLKTQLCILFSSLKK